ncbi:MAG: translation initiation factor IF-2 [Chlamydiales bacterium]|nr:translation initiation factor IF-2 [Chlamydiales bacterium]
MAKNLKLNIKNAQLAEALNLGKAKKPAAPKKKEVEPVAPPPAPPIEEQPRKEEIVAQERAAPEVKPEPPKKEPAKAAKEPLEEIDDRPPPPPREEKPVKLGPVEPRERQPYVPRQSSGDERPAFRRPSPSYPSQGAAPGGGRPPYQPRPPFRPSYPPRPGAPSGGGYPPRTGGPSTGGYPPRTGGPSGGYPPRTGGPSTGYPPRTGGGYPPRTGGPGGYGAPRRPTAPTEAPKALPSKREDKGPGGAPRKAGFKEFRDVKPQKRTGEGQRFDSRDRQGLRDSEDETWRKKRPSHKMRPGEIEETIIRPKELNVRIPISVKDLASAMKLKASQLLAKLLMQGVVLTLNDMLDDETTVQLLGHEFECEIKIDRTEEERIRITDKTIKQEILESTPASLVLRPPVVTFMGHVDHGKTSLIDKIRSTNIAAGEAGAITQHIGAFKCHTAVGDITILDTPGHEAFSAMRSRGADVTDIIVLVIAGDEGMRAQTLEAIEQATKAAVPILVAINKSDKPNFNPETVYRQLADNNLLPEPWGGTTITVNCSAHTGAGVKELLEMLALQAEILELKANPHARARGAVIESEMHKGMGPVATLLVKNGTLRIGDPVVFDQHWARVKTMQDERGKEMTEAGPSTPVKITGLSGLPEAGSDFIVVKNEKEARDLSYERTLGKKHATMSISKRAPIESFMEQTGGKLVKKTLSLILRADVQGSLDALKNSIAKILSKKVDINVISADVGEISESDIELAAASKAPIIGFHTKIASHADRMIKELKVVVKTHDVIYHAVDDIKEIMLALLDKIPQENDTGSAEVKTTFKASQLGVIAGCQVLDGTIKRNNHIRVIRDKEVVWKGAISSLRRVKEDVREVSKGYECGILLNNYNDVKVGDILQAYEITYLQQEL